MNTVQKYISVFTLFLFVLGSAVFAQPANDDCANAINITTLDGTCQSGFTTTGSTNDVGVGSGSGLVQMLGEEEKRSRIAGMP